MSANDDNDARAQIVMTLREIAADHSEAAGRAIARGHEAIAARYLEVRDELIDAASAIETRRAMLFAYEDDLEHERRFRVIDGGAA